MAAPHREIAVISDQLLADLVKEQAPQSIKEYGDDSDASYTDIKSLRIDFKSILRIANLESFSNLTKLQLDNNLIEKIENLSSLVKLTWLDLSYNNIENIEGLDALVHLSDLSLNHNKISTIGGLDSLKKLDVLSIGDNELEDLVGVATYLRTFKSLRSVSLSGNPLSKEENYTDCLVAYIPNLRYLDWTRISDESRTHAALTLTSDIERLTLLENEASAKQQKIDDLHMTRDMYANAGVPDMTGSDLWEYIYTHDPQIELLFVIPGIADSFASFKECVITQTQTVGAKGLTVAETREREHTDIKEAIAEAIKEVSMMCHQESSALLAKKDDAMIEAHEGGAAGSFRLEQLLDEVDILKARFMDRELDLQGRIEEVCGTFERSLSELGQGMLEITGESFTMIRKSEETFYNDVTRLAIGFLEGYAKGVNEDNVEVSDELHMLLRDKETVSNVVTNMHDKIVLQLDTKEESISDLMKTEAARLVKGLADDEFRRNRNRIKEIATFSKHIKEDIDAAMDDM
eukprot:m.111169 g.111169  ORF g.111169 m.111169 type:complete len:519 (-) comp16996_c0_seq2:168-1724(-)